MFTRLILGFPFVYLISGFPLARLFLPEEKTVSLKLILTSFACSLFLTYPAGVLTTVLEGQSAAAIYSVHLPHSLLSLGLISFILFFVLLKSNSDWWKLSPPKVSKTHVILASIILLYSFFVFWNLGRADVTGDDYDLGYQAYNLHDGIQAARRAYILSFATHPPLFMTIKHYGMQLFSPYGLETLSGWMFRGVEGMIGIGTILATYLLVSKFFSKRTALITALFLAVNNYLIFYGRYFEREIYYLPFIILAFYFCLTSLQTPGYRRLILVGFLLGAALLIKASALVAIPPVVLTFWLKGKSLRRIGIVLGTVFLIYTPVIIFNILMYLNTGYLDGTFSRIFGVYHPLNTGVPENSFLVNPITTFFLLADMYGYPIFFFFLLSLGALVVWTPRDRLSKLLALSLLTGILFFMFTPMRAYYLIFFTIPLVIFAANFSSWLLTASKAWMIPLSVLLVFSTVYSYRSNLISQQLGPEYGDVGAGGDYRLLMDNFWHTDFSLASAAFSPERGLKTLKQRLDNIYKPGSCLELQQDYLDLSVRYYLNTHDLVRKAFFGNAYKPDYSMCKDVNSSTSKKITIYYDPSGYVSLK